MSAATRRSTEAAVYYCTLEAVQNAIRHGGAGAIAITLPREAERLGFAVVDDGPGFDVADAQHPA